MTGTDQRNNAIHVLETADYQSASAVKEAKKHLGFDLNIERWQNALQRESYRQTHGLPSNTDDQQTIVALAGPRGAQTVFVSRYNQQQWAADIWQANERQSVWIYPSLTDLLDGVRGKTRVFTDNPSGLSAHNVERVSIADERWIQTRSADLDLTLTRATLDNGEASFFVWTRDATYRAELDVALACRALIGVGGESDETRPLTAVEYEQIEAWAAERGLGGSRQKAPAPKKTAEEAAMKDQRVAGYMLFLPEQPLCSSLRHHPASTPEDPNDTGEDPIAWDAERWARAYHLHDRREAAEAEVREDAEAWAADPDHDDEPPMTVAPVQISANGTLSVMDDFGDGVIDRYTAAQIYDEFGMSPDGIDEVSARSAAPDDDDPMNDSAQRPDNGPSLG